LANLIERLVDEAVAERDADVDSRVGRAIREAVAERDKELG
jgi:hypothetical protein